jgi:hypothetical protein
VSSGNDTLFLVSRCTASAREAHVAEERDSIWLYLTRPESREVDAVVWLLNTPAAPAHPTQEPYRSEAGPPPAPAALLLPGGVCAVPTDDRWRFLWSNDGLAVAALLDGRPIGFVWEGARRGRARFVVDGAHSWALPWDPGQFRAYFGESIESVE